MITGQLKSQVDKVWDAFWTGGISNPISVVEQITYLLFIKRLDEVQTTAERKAQLTGKPIENPIFSPDQQHLRWSKFKNLGDPTAMFERVRDQVFPFIKNLHKGKATSFAKRMEDAFFMIPKPSLLVTVVDLIDQLPMDDRDTKGDLYEYLLSQLTTAGKNGQFRTPRHIIKLMVQMMKPSPDDLICDPACGTGGFLMVAEQEIRDQTSNLVDLSKEQKEHYHNHLFTGFDFDASMLRIGVMNLLLHGVENPKVDYRDSLSDHGDADIRNAYSLILANPPFKGSVDYDTIAPDLIRALGKTPKKAAGAAKKPTEKTELLFLALILRLLKLGGRAAVIVPDGVLFGSSNAHQEIRKTLVEGHKLDAVISMPSGVFRPYAGVSTGILLFTRTDSGGTDKVWFYDMQADGFSLDDKRTPLDQKKHETNNLPDVLARWNNLKTESDRPRTAQSFMVPKAEIAAQGYDLSLNRYKEVVHEAVNYDSPKVIINRVRALNQEIETGLKQLEGLLG